MSQPRAPITLDQAASVGRFFGLAIVAIEPSVMLEGSPERSQSRCAVRDATGRPYVLEHLAPSQYTHKARIAHILADLASHGFGATVTYLVDVSGESIVRYDGHLWQMAPYVTSQPLPRPEWVHEGWRGRAFAQALIDLRRAASSLNARMLGPAFELPAHIDDLLRSAQQHHRNVAVALEPIACELGPLLRAYSTLPTAFCHGDVHPLNALWTETGLRALIDWEFCGIKAVLYDVSALMGCVGIEEPDALSGPLVQELLSSLGEARFAQPDSWRWLPDLVLAVRFAWMSEWLRKHDQEMIALELEYMMLLVAQQKKLRDQWLAWAGFSPSET